MAETTKKTTLEDVWRTIRELGEAQKETDRQLKETDYQLKKGALELQKRVDKTSRSIDKTNGNFNNKWGQFLENLVEGDLVRLLNQRGIQVDKVLSQVKYLRSNRNFGAEYDLIAVNGSEIVVFEIKTTFSIENLYTLVEKLMRVRERFPEYRDKKIYGGIAYLKASENAVQLAQERGLFLIKAPGGAKGGFHVVQLPRFCSQIFLGRILT